MHWGLLLCLLLSLQVLDCKQKFAIKWLGFKGHVQIVNYDNNNSEVSVVPIDKNQDFYPKFNSISGIKNVQVFASKGGILRTENNFEGIIFKGVSTDYNWSFFKEYMVDGRIPDLTLPRTKEVLLSKTVMNRLQLQLNDTILSTFPKNDINKIPSNRKYTIVGIYNTGFAQFDNSVMIGDLREVQRLNNWTNNQVGGFEVLLDNFDEH